MITSIDKVYASLMQVWSDDDLAHQVTIIKFISHKAKFMAELIMCCSMNADVLVFVQPHHMIVQVEEIIFTYSYTTTGSMSVVAQLDYCTILVDVAIN